jgi:hypothetical protein
VITFIFIKGVTQDMNTFKRKALFTAVVAGLGAAGTAEAVYLSPNNMGQVLVYPYYTTQTIGGTSFTTLITVVNTTSRAKAVKVRVLEGKTSAEVLDFNLFLSPNDVWAAAISPIDAGSASAGAQIQTFDTSCTNPAIGAGVPVPFRNFQYAAGDAALPGTGLDRTREGYVEILEMGPLSGTWAAAVTHSFTTGLPANCAVVQTVALPPSIGAPGGGLAGTGTLMNVNSGFDAGYKADALDAWSNVSRYSVPTSTSPTLAGASPPISLVLNVGQQTAAGNSALATIYRTEWNALLSGVVGGGRAVAAVYMHSSVINEYILDAATLSNTDWVITQPLKNLFVNATTAATPYSNVLTTAGACEIVGFQYFNREERGAAAGGTDFSPTPPSAPSNTLCWESNVLSIRNPSSTTGAHTLTPTTQSLVLGSFNVTNVNVTAPAGTGFQNGWAELSFNGANATGAGMAGSLAASDRAPVGTDVLAIAAVGGAHTFFGLPVTGFMVRTFRNNTPLACTAGSTATCANAFSSAFNHSYRTRIAP